MDSGWAHSATGLHGHARPVLRPSPLQGIAARCDGISVGTHKGTVPATKQPEQARNEMRPSSSTSQAGFGLAMPAREPPGPLSDITFFEKAKGRKVFSCLSRDVLEWLLRDQYISQGLEVSQRSLTRPNIAALQNSLVRRTALNFMLSLEYNRSDRVRTAQPQPIHTIPMFPKTSHPIYAYLHVDEPYNAYEALVNAKERINKEWKVKMASECDEMSATNGREKKRKAGKGKTQWSGNFQGSVFDMLKETKDEDENAKHAMGTLAAELERNEVLLENKAALMTRLGGIGKKKKTYDWQNPNYSAAGPRDPQQPTQINSGSSKKAGIDPRSKKTFTSSAVNSNSGDRNNYAVDSYSFLGSGAVTEAAMGLSRPTQVSIGPQAMHTSTVANKGGRPIDERDIGMSESLPSSSSNLDLLALTASTSRPREIALDPNMERNLTSEIRGVLDDIPRQHSSAPEKRTTKNVTSHGPSITTQVNFIAPQLQTAKATLYDLKFTLEQFIARGGPAKQVYDRIWEDVLICIAAEELEAIKKQTNGRGNGMTVPETHPTEAEDSSVVMGESIYPGSSRNLASRKSSDPVFKHRNYSQCRPCYQAKVSCDIKQKNGDEPCTQCCKGSVKCFKRGSTLPARKSTAATSNLSQGKAC